MKHKYDLFTIYSKLNNIYNFVDEVYKVRMNEEKQTILLVLNNEERNKIFFPSEIYGYKIETIDIKNWVNQKTIMKKVMRLVNTPDPAKGYMWELAPDLIFEVKKKDVWPINHLLKLNKL